MQLTKKILLSLTFSMSLTLTIFYFIGSIATQTEASWFEGDFTNLGRIMWWLLFGLFFLSTLSSFLWLINFGSGFWLWKVPALLILPFSVPFLILDYLELNKRTKITKASKNLEPEISQLTLLVIILIINYFIVSGQIAIIILVAVRSPLSNWAWLWMVVPLLIICGSIFSLIDYFHPNKIFQALSYLGLTFSWVYSFFNIIEKKKTNYFLKSSKNVNNVVEPFFGQE